MHHIKQHNNHSCAIASIAMLTDNVSYKTIKNYCRKHMQYNVTQKSGCFIEGVQFDEYLKSLGHDTFDVADGAVGRISQLTRYNKAIVFMISDHGGHAVAWDGCRIFDPEHEAPYTEGELFKHYDMPAMKVWFFAIRIHPLKRLTNRIKVWYYATMGKL